MRQILFTISLLCIIQFCYGQENYLPGYIIKADKDTLKGFIDYRNWGTNPRKISFKKNLTDENSIYKPLDISGFGVSGDAYESAIVKVEILYPDITNSQLELKTDTAFLQTLVSGIKTLYLYLPVQGRDHFYIKQNEGFELLTYKRYQKERPEGGILEYKNNRYFGQLSLYLNDCPIIQKKTSSIRYSKRSLMDLFQLYYANCSKSGAKFEKKSEKATVEFSIVAGVTESTLKFIAPSFLDLGKINYQPSANLTAGFAIETIFARNQRKISMYNELAFTSYNFQGTYTPVLDPLTTDATTVTRTDTKIGMSYIRLNNMVRYYFNTKSKIRLFASAGFSAGVAISETNYRKEYYDRAKPPITDEGRAIDEIKKTEFGYILGIGAKLKRYSLQVRYEKGDGISVSTGLKSLIPRVGFLVGYRF